jgi:hypothetical protein
LEGWSIFLAELAFQMEGDHHLNIYHVFPLFQQLSKGLFHIFLLFQLLSKGLVSVKAITASNLNWLCQTRCLCNQSADTMRLG